MDRNKLVLEEKIKVEYNLPSNFEIDAETCISLLVGKREVSSFDPFNQQFLEELIYNSPRSLYPLLWLQLGFLNGVK